MTPRLELIVAGSYPIAEIFAREKGWSRAGRDYWTKPDGVTVRYAGDTYDGGGLRSFARGTVVHLAFKYQDRRDFFYLRLGMREGMFVEASQCQS